MNEYKWVVITAGKQDEAERKIYAQMIRAVIASRGRTTALKFLPPPNDFVEVQLSELTDDEIRPENGFYLFGRNPAVFGKMTFEKGLTSKALAFREMTDGRFAARIKTKWTAKTIISKNVIPISVALSMGALSYNEDYCCFENFQFDVNDVIDTYQWDDVLDSEPDYVVVDE